MRPILAQKGADAAGIAAVLLLFICGILIVALVIGILFLLTLHRALDRCSPRNRTMEPGMVWLNLIPLFSMVWCSSPLLEFPNRSIVSFARAACGARATTGTPLG
jgi:hypothetical protein